MISVHSAVIPEQVGADENDRITEFQEKPKNPKSNLASMGIYIFNWDILKQCLTVPLI